ncbi:MAG: divalent-cation tolerance protein CutA [Candidatus Marinimicrobia bacterium]|nr:divalent-cation tolerance protein CutA [Candidatus Neomarinimicrobiota bacterium]TFB10981.1 divalent-cation tolerance protein CutA [Candidatus Marinimicrobia bacterium MT.SAG.2]
MTEFAVVLISASSESESEEIISTLLNKRLIACANLSSKTSSSYWWKGSIEKSDEFIITAKTRLSLVAKITEEVKIIHSYEVPEIIALPVLDGSRDYLDWLNDELPSNE